MKDWIIIHTSNDPNHSEIIKSVLEDHKIKAVLMDKTDSMNKFLMNGEIEIYVQSADAVNAKHILSKNDL